MLFADRVDAGRALAGGLAHLQHQDVVVLGLPRGGVPVAYEVAEALGKPLDVIVVRKLGVPFQPELAIGGDRRGRRAGPEPDVVARLGVTETELQIVERRERAILEDRVARLRRGRRRLDLTGRVAVVVDDGIATGATARVACQVARSLGAALVVLAVPVAPPGTVGLIREADEVVTVSTPARFSSVGEHYLDFSPTTDEEVVVLLDAAARRVRTGQPSGELPDCDLDVRVPADGVVLDGHLHLPEPASGVVVFAHGSGSSRHSPRNRFVAGVLQRSGLGTLLLDLLTPAEERDRGNVFDIELLAGRLAAATRWLRARDDAADCRFGYFGASTGAGAALWAAADRAPVSARSCREGDARISRRRGSARSPLRRC